MSSYHRWHGYNQGSISDCDFGPVSFDFDLRATLKEAVELRYQILHFKPSFQIDPLPSIRSEEATSVLGEVPGGVGGCPPWAGGHVTSPGGAAALHLMLDDQSQFIQLLLLDFRRGTVHQGLGLSGLGKGNDIAEGI